MKTDIKNESASIILSDGEKTTLAFAYFLAKLKMNYNENSLKNLVIIIDDPISSLDESRIYATSYLVAKINKEIINRDLDANSEDKAQIFVLTHNNIFMSNLIRILGKCKYYVLNRNNSTLKFEYKNNAAGYFDTFYMNLFKEIYSFAMEEILNDDEDKALNYGNKIRMLFESFMKVNFISKFIRDEYRNQVTFSSNIIKEIINEIKHYNKNYIFCGDVFSDEDNNDNFCVIQDEDDLYKKLDSVVKGFAYG
ncbi:AAA family ATPase [Campylobacter ureolyticus]|uniref:AAA family ATPase n=1 Tax=Campylobacter ureolyticus TaxID=827 RepID=UPI0009DA9EE3|nr:AAA family ATPase [Campylobacter ureolyticus]QQY36582.1 AAA family ATPase [Campylobacter ureolyticus]